MGRRLPGGPSNNAQVALCHEWLGARHGSEKTFEAMAGAFPRGDLFALTHDRSAGLDFGGRQVATTFLDRLAPLQRRRDLQLPLMPLAWRWASRCSYDVVVTSSHACAKGFRPARRALHLCYCYTPMRYLWLSSIDTRQRQNVFARLAERRLRRWDLSSVGWVDEFAAISTAVQSRIRDLYGRPSRVIHPPVDTDYFTPSPAVPREGFVLSVSRMVPYKRLDLSIRACHEAGRPLVIAGAGTAEPALRTLAADLRADVRFVVAPDDETLRQLYRTADILLFPAEEDFGIVPVEAQACGTPVVAFGRGGALDTVLPGKTGVLVDEQTIVSLAAGLDEAAGSASVPACRKNAERFSRATFRDQFVDWVLAAAASQGIAVDDPRTNRAA